jgi:3-hydroxyacyl-CoA dehydrogenase
VIGGGLMGAGITTSLLVNGAAVVLFKEVAQKFLDDGVGRVKSTVVVLS